MHLKHRKLDNVGGTWPYNNSPHTQAQSFIVRWRAPHAVG